eukprot:COSAG02_NODE_1102_length_14571_cov_27.965243_16_plen_31_part_00
MAGSRLLARAGPRKQQAINWPEIKEEKDLQ